MRDLNKKLGKKGFTLIELLAVIVILAIILAVTIPSVLTTMQKARANQLQNAADTVSEWFTKEYNLVAVGESADAPYINFLNGSVMPTTKPANGNATSVVLESAGVAKAEANIDVANSFIYYNTDKQRVCVILTAKNTGNFYNNIENGNTKLSSGC